MLIIINLLLIKDDNEELKEKRFFLRIFLVAFSAPISKKGEKPFEIFCKFFLLLSINVT